MIRAKDNPFTVGRIEAMDYLWRGFSWPELKSRLVACGHTAAIVGPHGGGKTTLLREVESRLRQDGVETKRLFMNLDLALPWRTIRECVDATPERGVLLFDGASHLPFWRFRQLRRLARRRRIGLVITGHEEGLLSTLAVCHPGLELLIEVVETLLDAREIFSKAHLADLYQAHDGNLRDCLWRLYDEYAVEGNACRRERQSY
jgi:hypothetical protein